MTLMVGLSVPTEETPASVRVQQGPRGLGAMVRGLENGVQFCRLPSFCPGAE